MELKDNPMFPGIKTQEQQQRVERTLAEYENEKSRAFNAMARFFAKYSDIMEAYADSTEDMQEMAEDLRDVKREIESACDAQEAFMRAVVGR